MIARKKRILIIIVTTVLTLIAVLGGVYAFLYFKTDILKSNQELFYKYIAKNEDIINSIDDELLNAYENKINNTQYDNSGEISFSISNKATKADENNEETQTDENNVANESQLNTAINNVKLSFNGSSDLANGKLYQDVKVLYSDDNKELFDVKFLKQDELYGLKTDEIVTKYVSLKNENIKQLYNRIGIKDTNNIANKIEKYDYNAILKMPTDRKNQLKQQYMNVLNNHIQSSNFSKEKKSTVTVNNEVYNSNKYILKLTGDEVINLKVKLLETLLNDQNTLSEISKLLRKDDEYIKVLKEKIQENIEDIKRQPSNDNIALQIAVYELNGKLLKTECITENENIEIINNNSSNVQKVSINDTQTNKGVIVTSYNITRNTSEDNNSLIFEMNTTENGRESSNITVDITNTGNINSNNIDTAINATINDDTGEKSIKYINKKTFNTSTQIDNLSDNTVTLNDMTIEYNKNLIQAIQDRLMQIYAERTANVGLDSNTLTSELKYAIKTMKEQFNRDEFEKQIQRSLNYVKQDASVDLEFVEKLQKSTTTEQIQKVKEERLVKRLNEFGIKAVSDEENDTILIDSGYNYNYIYYIDYDKYTVTRAE